MNILATFCEICLLVILLICVALLQPLTEFYSKLSGKLQIKSRMGSYFSCECVCTSKYQCDTSNSNEIDETEMQIKEKEEKENNSSEASYRDLS